LRETESIKNKLKQTKWFAVDVQPAPRPPLVGKKIQRFKGNGESKAAAAKAFRNHWQVNRMIWLYLMESISPAAAFPGPELG